MNMFPTMIDVAKARGASPELIQEMEDVKKLNDLNLPQEFHDMVLDGISRKFVRKIYESKGVFL